MKTEYPCWKWCRLAYTGQLVFKMEYPFSKWISILKTLATGDWTSPSLTRFPFALNHSVNLTSDYWAFHSINQLTPLFNQSLHKSCIAPGNKPLTEPRRLPLKLPPQRSIQWALTNSFCRDPHLRVTKTVLRNKMLCDQVKVEKCCAALSWEIVSFKSNMFCVAQKCSKLPLCRCRSTHIFQGYHDLPTAETRDSDKALCGRPCCGKVTSKISDWDVPMTTHTFGMKYIYIYIYMVLE